MQRIFFPELILMVTRAGIV